MKAKLVKESLNEGIIGTIILNTIVVLSLYRFFKGLYYKYLESPAHASKRVEMNIIKRILRILNICLKLNNGEGVEYSQDTFQHTIIIESDSTDDLIIKINKENKVMKVNVYKDQFIQLSNVDYNNFLNIIERIISGHKENN
jgi:hypothetical protein